MSTENYRSLCHHRKQPRFLSREIAVTLWAILLAGSLNTGVIAASKEGGGAFDKPKAGDQQKLTKQGSAKTRQQTARSISGRWTLRSKCNTGKFTVVLNIRQKSATTFAGTGRGITSGYNTVIENGRISGNKVSFSRRNVSGGGATSTHSSGTLSANGRRMSGKERGILWNCTFAASK